MRVGQLAASLVNPLNVVVMLVCTWCFVPYHVTGRDHAGKNRAAECFGRYPQTVLLMVVLHALNNARWLLRDNLLT